jgi:hypothetical protein
MPATLQTATNIVGPFTNISEVTAPYTISPANARQFFRLWGQ